MGLQSNGEFKIPERDLNELRKLLPSLDIPSFDITLKNFGIDYFQDIWQNAEAKLHLQKLEETLMRNNNATTYAGNDCILHFCHCPSTSLHSADVRTSFCKSF